jgi:hypothetical protein
MISQTLTTRAESASLRYRMLIESWRSMFMRALDRPNFDKPSVVNDLVGDAREMAKNYALSERTHVETQSVEIASEAHTATLDALRSQDARDLSEAVTEQLKALERYVLNEIAIQIERDIAFLRQSYLSVALQVKIAARSQRIGLRSALIQYRVGNAAELSFFFRDRRNQRWPSHKFIRSVWRQHLLAVYNETVLIDLAEHGQRFAEVSHLSPSSQFHGMKIALSSNTSHPTYAEIRNEIFHPNSEAILKVPETV